jgi:hypothetical protein
LTCTTAFALFRRHRLSFRTFPRPPWATILAARRRRWRRLGWAPLGVVEEELVVELRRVPRLGADELWRDDLSLFTRRDVDEGALDALD